MKTSNIIFKPLTEDNLTLLYQWFQTPHILKWYARGEKYTFEIIKKKYLPRINNASIQNFIICDQDKSVGYIQLYHVDKHLPDGILDCSHPLFNDFKPNELVGIDLFIADENYLRVGFGSEAFELFINIHIKGKFKAVIVDPLKQNTIAISFFKKNGFQQIMSQNSHYNLMILKLG